MVQAPISFSMFGGTMAGDGIAIGDGTIGDGTIGDGIAIGVTGIRARVDGELLTSWLLARFGRTSGPLIQRLYSYQAAL